MPLAIVANNLVVFLATFVACSSSFCLLLLGYLMVQLTAKMHFHRSAREEPRYREYEKTWYLTAAWLGSAFMTALMFSLIFQEIYDSPSIIDLTTVVLAMYPVYQLMMFLWLFVQFVFIHPTPTKTPFVFIGLALAVAVINTVLIFLLPSHDWTHYLNILLFVPPVFAIFATNSASTFRFQILPLLTPAHTAWKPYNAHSRAPARAAGADDFGPR